MPPMRSRWRFATCTTAPARSRTGCGRTRRAPPCAAGERCVRDRMIARLRGTLAEKTPGRLVVDVHGVGYDVLVPLSTFYPLGEPGSDVALRVHTHVREDVIAL